MLQKNKSLGAFSLCMISVASIINLRGSPLMASVGLNAIFFYVAAAICYLIPSALICAEMASTWPKAGGVYLWVRHAFGRDTGFLAIWLEWINNVIGFPATLAFMGVTIAYIFLPSLVQHKIYLISMMLILLWGTTFFNFLGVKASSRLNILGALLGTLIPGVVIVILALIWFLNGHPSQIHFSVHGIIPSLHINNIVFFTGVLGAYAGMQITAFHAPNVAHPKRDYPLAIFWAVILIVLTTIAVALAIALVVPEQNMSLISGMLDGFADFFNAFHMSWAVHVLAFLMVIGSFSSLSSWLLGPARGLLVAVNEGHLPAWLAKTNRHEMPVVIMLIQAVVASLFSLLFVFMPNFNTSFWILTALTSQSTVLMNMLMFLSAFWLRVKEKSVHRPFAIPGGWIGISLVSGLGLLTCFGAFILGFFPPAQLFTGNLLGYESILMGATLIYLFIPLLVIRHFKK